MTNIYDCVIIGGGIGGLTAALYLARFHCKICVIDDKQSRASIIPLSHNFPAFPNGISGKAILKKLTEQYDHYQQALVNDTALTIKKNSAGIFVTKTKKAKYHSRFIIMATGVIDIEPALPNIDAAIKNGLIRHCLICDAFEVTDKKIGVLGNSRKALKVTSFLQTYSNHVTLLNVNENIRFTKKEKKEVDIVDRKIIYAKITGKHSIVRTEEKSFKFDTIYSALGIQPRTDIAIKLGINHTQENLLKVNSHQATNIIGVYAIGDIVPGLNQMCTAASQGAIAAVAIFNQLKKMGK